MNLRQAAEQALEAMDNLHRTGDTQVFDLCHRETTEALRAALAEEALQRLTDVSQEIEAALAEPEQEPVFDCPRCGHCCPQRKPLTDEEIDEMWREALPLTDEEIDDMWRDVKINPALTFKFVRAFARDIEQEHGIGEKHE